MSDFFNVILKSKRIILNLQTDFQRRQVRPQAEAKLKRRQSKEGYIDINLRPKADDSVTSSGRRRAKAETGLTRVACRVVPYYNRSLVGLVGVLLLMMYICRQLAVRQAPVRQTAPHRQSFLSHYTCQHRHCHTVSQLAGHLLPPHIHGAVTNYCPDIKHMPETVAEKNCYNIYHTLLTIELIF